eukprot:gene8895-10940_t
MAATGLRLWLSENCADINTLRIRMGDYSEDVEFGRVFLDRTVACIEAWQGRGQGRVNFQIAAHAPDNCSPAMLHKLSDLASKYGLTRTVHLAQSMEEVHAVAKMRDGLTPAGYLDREGFLGPDLVGAHWTYCTAADVELLAARGVQLVPLGLEHEAGLRAAAADAAARAEEIALNLADLDALDPREDEETELAGERAVLGAAEKAVADLADARSNLGGDKLSQKLSAAL